MIREVAGRNNQSVKLVSKLHKKKYRRERGLFVAEGFDLLHSALEAGVLPAEILVREDLVRRLPSRLREEAGRGQLDIGVCAAPVLEKASALGGAADVVAVFKTPTASLTDLDLAGKLNVYLAGVGDPGNVGTIVRSAAAFGAGGVALAPGSADPFSPKALRAGMGAHFLLPLVSEVTPEDLWAKLAVLESRGAALPLLVLADPTGDVDLRALGPVGPSLLILGAERDGLETLVRQGGWSGTSEPGTTAQDSPLSSSPAIVRRVRISHQGFESLNVAMAGTIFLYELSAGSRSSA